VASYFDDDDGIVHDEASGNREGHEREIVQAVVAEIMTPKVPMRARGNGDAGMMVAQTFRRKANTTKITRMIEMMSATSTS